MRIGAKYLIGPKAASLVAGQIPYSAGGQPATPVDNQHCSRYVGHSITAQEQHRFGNLRGRTGAPERILDGAVLVITGDSLDAIGKESGSGRSFGQDRDYGDRQDAGGGIEALADGSGQLPRSFGWLPSVRRHW